MVVSRNTPDYRDSFDAPRVEQLTGDSMVGKRTEWLEKQERKITATVNEHRSEQQRLTEQMAASIGNIDRISRDAKLLHAECHKTSQKTQQLFDETQWVYGKALTSCRGVF